MSGPGEHRQVGRGVCACGERAALGENVWRWWDRHLLEVGVEAVTVPLAALRALVAKTRELDESISDDRALTVGERASFQAEVQALVEALGVEGL